MTAAIRLRSSDFRREREDQWLALEALVARVERRGLASLAPDELHQLPRLYRAAVSGLSVARAISLDRALLDYLESLVARAYFCVYGVKPRSEGAVRRFFAHGFPAAVRRCGAGIGVALGLLVAGTVCGWAVYDADTYAAIVPDGMAQGRAPTTSTAELRDVLYSGADASDDELSLFATFLFTHNAKIGMLSFALGFALGIPAVLLLFYNGLLLGAMAGADPADPATARAPREPVDYTKALDPEGLRGARIGVARRRFGFHPDVDAIMERAIGVLRQRGAVLVDPADEGNGERFGDAEFTVLLYELKADLNAYLERLGPGAPVHSLKEIIDFNERHRKEEMPYFGQENFLSAEAKGPLTSPEYLEALEKCRRLAGKEGIDALMDKHRLDAVLAPTGGPAWLTDLVNGDHFSGGSSSAAAVAGYPNITLPAGFIFGLPVGLSFFGRAWSESVLIRIAYAFEQATLVRRPPGFLATADVRVGG